MICGTRSSYFEFMLSPQYIPILSHRSIEMKYRDITITVKDEETKEQVSLTLIGFGISIKRILEFIKERIK
jgi:hypothetical protein